MENCYIVVGRPNTPRKFKLLLHNLEILRNNTECTIILSVNHFPNGIENWKGELYDYIIYSDINEILDGGKLLVLFRSVGVNIRMQNKINVEQDGKFVSITDKFKHKSEVDDDK